MRGAYLLCPWNDSEIQTQAPGVARMGRGASQYWDDSLGLQMHEDMRSGSLGERYKAGEENARPKMKRVNIEQEQRNEGNTGL
jgi:hypothetical protein